MVKLWQKLMWLVFFSGTRCIIQRYKLTWTVLTGIALWHNSDATCLLGVNPLEIMDDYHLHVSLTVQ